MAAGDGDVPQAADQSSQPVLYSVQIGSQVVQIRDNAADEPQAAYNELVAPTYQPLADPITTNYLGQPRN